MFKNYYILLLCSWNTFWEIESYITLTTYINLNAMSTH